MKLLQLKPTLPAPASALFLAVLFWLGSGATTRAHDNLMGGAVADDAGAPLEFHEGEEFSTNSGWVMRLDLKDATGQWWVNQEILFSALAATSANGGPAEGHAAPGAFLQLEFVSLTGPEGARLSVRKEDQQDPAVFHELFQVPTGTAAGTNRIALSESGGGPDSDPYGQIPGRRLWVDKSGLYVLGVRLIDTSTNGAGGGPVHPPSEILSMHLQAAQALQIQTGTNGGFQLDYTLPEFETWVVEATSTPEIPASWAEVHRAAGGDEPNLEIWTDAPDVPSRFYRLKKALIR